MRSHAAKRSQLTIGLCVLFAALIGLIAWMELGDQQATQAINENINSIVIKRRGHPNIELAGADANWKMVAPYSLGANAQRINPLLSLGSAAFDGYNTNDVDLPATGLATPTASVIIGSREFQLGNTDAGGERRYTLVDGKVSFVPSWVWSLIHGGVSAFADLSVFTELPDDVYLIQPSNTTQLAQPQKLLDLQADKVTAWPEDLSADANANPEEWTLSTTKQPDAAIAQMLRYQDRTLIRTKGDFAYAISNTRLDALLAP